jgi:hypothetical protein
VDARDKRGHDVGFGGQRTYRFFSFGGFFGGGGRLGGGDGRFGNPP